MGMRPTHDPYGGQTPLVDKLIGTPAYEVVRRVACNLDYIRAVGCNIERVFQVSEDLDDIKKLAAISEDIAQLALHVDEIALIAEHYPEFQEVYEKIPELLEVNIEIEKAYQASSRSIEAADRAEVAADQADEAAGRAEAADLATEGKVQALRDDLAASGSQAGATLVTVANGQTVQQRLDSIPSEVDAAGTADARVLTHNADANAHPALSAFITSEANRAETAADAALLSRGVFPTTVAALSNGVRGVANLVGGTDGTDGTFDLVFSGGAGSGAAGVFVVQGGVVVSVQILTAGNSYTSAPTLDFSASAGLAGASATALIAPNVAEGEYFSVPSADDEEYLILYRHEAGPVATEIKRYPSSQFVSRIDLQVQQGAGNNSVVDDFTAHANASPFLYYQTGEVSSNPIQPQPGGGLHVVALSSSAYYVFKTIYQRRNGVDVFGFDVEIELTSSGSSQEIGLAIGNDQNDWKLFLWAKGGRLVSYTNAGGFFTITASTGNAARAYTTGDTVKIWLETNLDGTGRLGITRADGVNEYHPVSGIPEGDVYFAYRGGGTPAATAIVKNITVDGLSKVVDERSTGARWLNLFPDTRLEGVSQGSFWAGTTALEDGEYVMTFPPGGSNVNSWEFPAVGPLRPGAWLEFWWERLSDYAGGVAVRNFILFYDAGGTEISRAGNRQINQVDVWEKSGVGARVPDNAAKVVLWAGSDSNTIVRTKHRRLRLYSDSSEHYSPVLVPAQSAAIIEDRRVFVSDSTGDDGNSGTEASPMKTLAAAVLNERVASGGRIILLNGEYSAPGIDFSPMAAQAELSIESRYGHRANLYRQATRGAITKTAGQNKVYQCSLANSPSEWVWEHGVPDPRTLIPLADRLALQRGRTHRLPSTRINKAASIAAIDAADDDDPRWYWESGTLYFSIYGGGDATSSDIRVSSGYSLQAGNGAVVQMIGIDCWYGNISFSNAASVLLHDVFMFGSRVNNISYNACGRFVSTACESAGSENDGFNSHNSANPMYRESVGMHEGIWSHDNLGDGHSDHASSRIHFAGGLYEYNGKAGIVPANGSQAEARNAHARWNGWKTPNGGGGFAITNAVSDGDLGVGTQFDLYDCIAENNAYNFMCGPAAESGGGSGGSTDANHAMHVYGGISRDALIAGYYARVGRLTVVDCRDAGSSAAKLAQNGGEIIVVTTTPLV